MYIHVHVGDMVVYGGGLDAYSMLQAVLDEGLPANRLILVVPNGTPPAFFNQEIADSVSRLLETLAVKVVSGLELVGVEVEDDLSALHLSGQQGTVTLPCAALVYLHHKQVNRQLFKGEYVCALFF